MMMRLSEAALATSGRVVGGDVAFDAVTTDSRHVASGDLFIALRGERFDGHDFVVSCIERGAVAAMVQHEIETVMPLLMVSDTRLGLGDLAAYWRSKIAIPLAAITGSNGKTTVKEMLAAILRKTSGDYGVHATEGNLNNDIGLPLTLLKLRAHHRYAVTEMGMNHPGEIAYLTRMAKPNVALVNNAAAAHLAGLGNIETVARAKGEIFQGLVTGGAAVINADDAFAPLWRELAASHRILTFGLEQQSDVSASYQLLADSSELSVMTPQGKIGLHLAVPGLHNVRNALAATAAAFALGIGLDDIKQGLEGFRGVKGRLQRKLGRCGAIVIDDTYNANPASMRAAISVLAEHPGRRIFVMGDMGELGNDATAMHAEIGALAKTAGIDALYAVGTLSARAVQSFGTGSRHFDTPETLVGALEHELMAGVTVLVKGSRFMRMERVVELLMAEEEKESRHAA